MGDPSFDKYIKYGIFFQMSYSIIILQPAKEFLSLPESDKTDRTEIDRALRLMREYLEDEDERGKGI